VLMLPTEGCLYFIVELVVSPQAAKVINERKKT
jgi:hypothetical protein